MTFAREAAPFAGPPAALAALAAGLGSWVWAGVLLFLALLLLLFFRIPRRRPPGDDRAVLAAANGVVTRIDRVEDAEVGPGTFHRVVTFLSVFDVHAQRVPASGEVIASYLREGAKVAAFRADAGDVNECHLTVIRGAGGELFGVRQIAGLLARRVVCYLEAGDAVARGELMGIIKFGSRVDHLIPAEYEILVETGSRLHEGRTPIATPPGPTR